MRPAWPHPYALPGHTRTPYLATPIRPTWLSLLYAHYPRVEISRIDRFRAYLGGGIRGRPPRDLPRLTASSSNSSPWRQDSSFSALSVLEITYSGNLLTRIGNQASFKSSQVLKSGLKLEKTVSLDLPSRASIIEL